MRKRVPLLIVLLLIAAAAVALVVRGTGEEDESIRAAGTTEATEADLGFVVGGRIESVNVREGENVAAGAVLAVLDVAELEAAEEQAAAQVAVAQARLTELERGARAAERQQARAVEEAARERLEEAERALERARSLYEGGAIARAEFERAETAQRVAAAQHTQALEQLRLVLEGVRPEQVEAQRAQLRLAEASRDQARIAVERARIVAPFAGIVTIRHREPGETVPAGAPVLTLMDPSDRWVRIYVREDAIGRVSLGDAATITIDSHPDSAFTGRVTHIASEAEFTPRNVQTTEERVKLVYAVKVAIEGDDGLALKPGVPADVVLARAAR